MLASLVIVFREVIEAGLIVGIVMAATRSVPRRGWWVAGGVLAGTVGASLAAAFAGELGALFNGSGQDLFNATILLVAVGMLTLHNGWMAGHGRELAREVRAVGSAVAAGERPLTAVAIVVAVAVLREGSEVVLFLYGILAAGGTSVAGMMAGGAFGIALGAALSAVHCHHRTDHAARRRARGAGGVLPAAGRLLPGLDHAAMGYVLAAR